MRPEAAFAWSETGRGKFAASMLQQMNAYNEFLIEVKRDQNNERKKREEEFAARNTALSDSFSKKRDELDQLDLHRKEALLIEQQELAKQKSEFETRNNTFVRRDLLRRLQNMVEEQKQLEVSKETSSKRWPVHVICGFPLILSATLIGLLALTVIREDRLLPHHAIPLSAATAIFASTLIYYLRWNDQWFREHSSAEFRARKLASDVIRAGWLAELVFEVKEKDRQLPDILFNRFSEGLFLDAQSSPTEHPADQMAASLGKVTSFKLGKDGTEVTIAAGKRSSPTNIGGLINFGSATRPRST